MAKATIAMPSGARVTIEGTPDEVHQLLVKFEGTKGVKPTSETAPPERHTDRGYVLELKSGGFFKERRNFADVREALEAAGHIIPRTTLSGTMLELVKSHELRRVKEEGEWKYVES